MDWLGEPAAAERLRDARLVSAEFMYKPRPAEPRARRVFDYALVSRLNELSQHQPAAVVLICDSEATAASFADLPAAYPHLRFAAVAANPELVADTRSDTPARCGWDDPDGWHRYNLTDRWARILCALEIARQIPAPGWLIMPAHDAVWGRGLLRLLMGISEGGAQNGLPAAVSPYTPYQHSAVPGADIPHEIIAALNAAFGRDSGLRWRLRSGNYQAFWGKTGLLPFGMSDTVLRSADKASWEDDLEIDRVLHDAGFGARCRWVGNPSLYRQALPVFDRAGLRAVIDRTLHYSLPIPGDTSLLTRPLDALGKLRRLLDPGFARALALSEAITAECQAEIAGRLARYGMSWVDWGAYRYVAQVGDPHVQVWRYQPETPVWKSASVV
ncbi:MAG: hypothetical protein IT319_22670 [Anaerolineae bacterium]|nr:hypothetical protein [Anaerolineae bacterium]